MLNDYLEILPPGRKFYMHTDHHKWDDVLVALGNLTELDVYDPPNWLKPNLTALLTNPVYMGCGHLKLMGQQLEGYQITKDIYANFMDAFFEYMWTRDSGRKFDDRKLLYTILHGDHNERGVLVVNSKGCASKFVAIPTEVDVKGYTVPDQFFMYHANGIAEFRQELAKFVIDYTDVNFTVIDLVAKVDKVFAEQLDKTLAALAAGLPVYQVDYSLQEGSKTKVSVNTGNSSHPVGTGQESSGYRSLGYQSVAFVMASMLALLI